MQVYQVTEADLARHETLEPSDVGRWYIVVNGAMQFVADEAAGRSLIAFLQDFAIKP